MDDDYEYRGMVATNWDLLRGDTSHWPDRQFWRALIESLQGPALDVGCGTGRLLIDFLQAGLDVDGVDVSPDMLSLCREKMASAGLDATGRLHQESMETLNLPRLYATIFVPSLSFQLLVDPAAAEAAMRQFRAHLLPGGALAMSFRANFWPERGRPADLTWTRWFKEAEATRDDGALVRRFMRVMFDDARQLLHEENRYEVLCDGALIASELHARSPSVCWYSQAQAQACFERAGFETCRVTSGDSLEPASPQDLYFKITAWR
jgi:SAM-dependent methyltransferase